MNISVNTLDDSLVVDGGEGILDCENLNGRDCVNHMCIVSGMGSESTFHQLPEQ